MKKYAGLIVLLVGIALGAAATVFGPDYIEPYLPQFGKTDEGVAGEVVSKRLEQDRLLVTVNASEGAILVTFTKKVPEIDLLVEAGDTVNLDIAAYKPFINNPKITRVKKPVQKPAMKSGLEQETTQEAVQPSEAEGVELPIPEQYKEMPAPQPKPAEAKKPAETEKPSPGVASPVANSAM